MCDMNNHEATYSDIIDPELYNRIITDEHLYIADSDRLIQQLIEDEITAMGSAEVVEVGCGPARIIAQVATIPHIHLTGVDHDQKFIAYAKKVIDNTRVRLVCMEFADYRHGKPVDVFFSQGTHHHIPKGSATTAYLQNIYKQLTPGGAYIISDEFLPDYEDEHDRHVAAVIWYSHIIANGKRRGFNDLAREEVKTLLDDLNEGGTGEGGKSPEQIELLLARVEGINDAAMTGNLPTARQLAEDLLTALRSSQSAVRQGDPTMDLSRGDYKVSRAVFRSEVEPIGFIVENAQSVGPVEQVGGMVVYKLRKPALR